jgi:hypothetical protein
MTSQIAARRRPSGAFLIGSFLTLASSFTLMAPLAQAQDRGFLPVTGTWTRGGNDTVAWLDLATWKIVSATEGGNPVADPQPQPWIPVVGDFDGDGVDSIQMFNPRDWRLLPAERGPVEGSVGDPIPWLPVAGDWDGDRIDTVKVFNACDSSLHNLGDGPSIAGYCDPDDWWFAVAVDWEGRGIDTLAAYQEQATGHKSAAVWSTVFGDWDGDGIDTQAELHMPDGQLVQGVEERVVAQSLASQTSSVHSVFDAAGLGGPNCWTTIKNKKTTWVKKYLPNGLPIYVCYSTWEEWTCCFSSSSSGTICSMKLKSGYTC